MNKLPKFTHRTHAGDAEGREVWGGLAYSTVGETPVRWLRHVACRLALHLALCWAWGRHGNEDKSDYRHEYNVLYHLLF